MKKIILLSMLFSTAIYAADTNQPPKTRKRKCDDNHAESAKLQRSELSGYTSIIIKDKANTYHKPTFIQTPPFILAQLPIDRMNNACHTAMENAIKNTLSINGSLSMYHPAQCIFHLE